MIFLAKLYYSLATSSAKLRVSLQNFAQSTKSPKEKVINNVYSSIILNFRNMVNTQPWALTLPLELNM